MDGAAILSYVYSFYDPEGGRRSSKERSIKFLEVSGLPVRTLPAPSVRITGTNGKGTTTLYVEQHLRAAGLPTICHVSPHVYSVRERIRVDGRPARWEEIGAALDRITPALETLRGSQWHPGPVNIWVWIAFALHAAAAPATHGVYEVGKGGRTDSVNVFSGGVVGLTNIGSDHLHEFGGSQTTLLAEKLGLCTSGDTLCHGPLPPELEAYLTRYCLQRNIAVRPATDLARWERSGDGVDSERQANAALARAIVRALDLEEKSGDFHAQELPVRIQERTIDARRFVLDGAHNAEAMLRLVKRLAGAGGKPRILVFGAQTSKDWRGFIRLLATVPGITAMICVETTTGDPVDSRTLAAWASVCGLRSTSFPGMLSGLSYALGLDWEECVVTGAFKLFRDFELALHHLGYGASAVPIHEIDPPQPWMRTLR